jgi:hypothetical protein
MTMPGCMADAPTHRAADAPARQPGGERAELLLRGPIASTLMRLSWPNVLVMLAQASTGLIETWWVSRLGMSALAGMAIVFPVVMLMQMESQGAMGGGISSAIARALGAGRQADGDALVLHALVINLAMGVVFSVLVLAFGPSLYGLLGGGGAELDAALRYSNVVCSGLVLMWLMNGLAPLVWCRSRYAGIGQCVSSRGSAVLWNVRSRLRALFRVSGGRPAVVAVAGRTVPHADRDRRWLARSDADWVAGLVIRGAGGWTGRVWDHDTGRDSPRRLVGSRTETGPYQYPCGKSCPEARASSR